MSQALRGHFSSPGLFLTLSVFREKLPYPQLRGVCCGGRWQMAWGDRKGFVGHCLLTTLFSQCPASAPV